MITTPKTKNAGSNWTDTQIQQANRIAKLGHDSQASHLIKWAIQRISMTAKQDDPLLACLNEWQNKGGVCLRERPENEQLDGVGTIRWCSPKRLQTQTGGKSHDA